MLLKQNGNKIKFLIYNCTNITKISNKNMKGTEDNQLTNLDDEWFIFELYRKTASSRIRYNGRYYQCARVERLLQ